MTATAPDEPSPRQPTTMRRDLASAYLVAGTRMGSWVIVSGLVYRLLGRDEFAMLALVRGTIGLLNYTSLGLAPALIHRAAKSIHSTDSKSTDGPLDALYSNAQAVAILTGVIGLALTAAYAGCFNTFYRIPASLPGQMPGVVLFIGIGVLMRLTSDAAGAVLQVKNRIWLDNLFLASGDIAWVVLTAIALRVMRPAMSPPKLLTLVALAFGIAGFLTFITRLSGAARLTGIVDPNWKLIRRTVVRSLLAFGLMVTLAQLADYLYAPTDYILIDRLLTASDLADYAPAVQIDSGLLLLVTGLSAVLLPKAALAHAGGAPSTVRKYYIRGTLASLILLSVASLVVWLIAPWLFRLWLGNSMPGTRLILPLVLANTIIGGSSAVGRSILLAVGRVQPFTISVLLAGAVNVVCSFAFVHYLHWGLRGIVLGTVVAVIGRCAIWMPWYVRRILQTSGPEITLPRDTGL